MILTPLVEQIRQKVQSPYPVATLGTVLEAEASLGFAIPSLLKELYLYVGNGGFGPSDCYLIGLQGGHEYWGDTLATLYADFRHWQDTKYLKDGKVYSPWPEQLLPAFLWPCTIYTCLDCSQPETPIYIYDTNFIKADNRHLPRPLMKHKASLSEWLEAINTGEDLWIEMDQLSRTMAERLTQEQQSS